MEDIAAEAMAEVVLEGEAEKQQNNTKFGIRILEKGDEAAGGYDIVAVHGIYGDREDTWKIAGTDERSASNWLTDGVYKEFSSSRIMTFGYDTSYGAGIYTMGGIREKALQLLNELVELRRGSNYDTDRPIIFIAHDLGGIIVKEAVWIANIENRKYQDIRYLARLFIFFSCPHRCSSIQDMEDKLANFLFAGKYTRPFGVMRSLKELARSTVEINESFIVCKMPVLATIMNVYSEEQDTSLQGFDKFTATLDVPFEKCVGYSKPHKDLCKMDRSDYIDRIHPELCRDSSPLRPNYDAVNFLGTLCLLAAPVYPLKSLYGPEHQFGWISANDTYKNWLNSPGPSILHVYGNAGVSDASEYIFQCLDAYRRGKESYLLYFTFNRYDDRCNSVEALLNSLMAQLINHNQNFYESVELQYEQMSHHSSWTLTDLLLCCRNLLSDWDNSGILCVVSCMNACDSSWAKFLEDICGFANDTERKFKFVITSTIDSDIQAALTDWPSINLDDRQEASDTVNIKLASDINLEVLELLQQQPIYYDFEKTITEKLSRCGHDKHWRRLILNQLRLDHTSSTKLDVQRELEILPPTTSKEIFARTMERVPHERRPWARKALVWIAYSFRPLQVSELAVALTLQVGTHPNEKADIDALVDQNIIGDLDETFKGIFIIKHNEVHFSYPDAQEFLFCAQRGVWYDVKDTAHEVITNFCLSYISLQQVQDSIAASYLDNSPDPQVSAPFIPRYSLRSYSIQFWPRHYKLIPKALPTKRALEFCQNTKAFRIWAEADWLYSNSVNRTNRAFLSLLPVFASYGLQDLVNKWLEDEARIPNAGKDRSMALAEAARNSHVEIVRKLLDFGGYNETSLQEALNAASFHCDKAVLDVLVAYAAGSSKNFKWPPVLLARAAMFGLEDIVKKLLESGASLEKACMLNNMSALHLAARHGHANVAKILLDHGASVTRLALYSRTPLHVASAYTQAAVTQVLLRHGADANALDDSKADSLYFASGSGGHKVVDILTRAGWDIGNDRKDVWTPLTVAAEAGFIKSVRVLLERNAKIGVKGVGDWTPIRHAASGGHMDIFRLLLENGADPNDDSDGEAILSKCAKDGNLEAVKLLVKHGAVVDAANAENWTALLQASYMGHKAIIAYLLDQNANIYHVNDEGQTSLLLAAWADFPEAVQLLAERGADVNLPGTSGWTPLLLSYDFVETTGVLLKNGANVNSKLTNGSRKGHTALSFAVNGGYVEVVKVLLAYNADTEVEYGDNNRGLGQTPLINATRIGNAEIVRLLLEAGANINHRVNGGNFALQYAVTEKLTDVLRILLEYNPDLNIVDNNSNTTLNCINSSTPLEMIKMLVNRGAQTEIRNNNRNTPLCTAVSCNNVEVVEYLLKKAELNIVGGMSGGPLHIACGKLNLALVELLKSAGADVNLVDPQLGTPLQSACRCPRSSYDKEIQEVIIRYLLDEAGADLTIYGGLYGSPLSAACGWSSSDTVKLMLDKGAKIDVKDVMGRVAIHLAAARSMANFQIILHAGGEVEVKDSMGRTALHWAAIGGQVDVVDRVISLSRGLVDQRDADGWTPLMWAARACASPIGKADFNAQEAIVKLLLERGADPCVVVKELDREWSPLKLARYHGADRDVIELLKQETKARFGDDAWDEKVYESKMATRSRAYCDCCLLYTHGIRYKCETCVDFDLCYKCYAARDRIHIDHSFKIMSLDEYEPEQESSNPNSDVDEDDEVEDEDDEDDEEEEEEEEEEDEEEEEVEEDEVEEEYEDEDED